jgi:hypothetical protein
LAETHRGEHRHDRITATGKTPWYDPSGWFGEMTSSTGLLPAELNLIL